MYIYILTIDINNTIFISENKEFVNYINASTINGPIPKEDKDMFIATQGPLSNTIESFWKMIILKEANLIIMLSKLQENNHFKCEQYWPKNETTPLIFPQFKIIQESEVFILDNSVLQRNFIIEFYNDINKNKVHVSQLHVLCWPDHSVPEAEIGYKMIEVLISYVDEYRNIHNDKPVVTHCSAGIGRTGTFYAIYNISKCLNIIKNSKEKKEVFFNVFNVIRKLREQRFGMISDLAQYKYIYEFTVEWIKRNFELI